jgi:hypothetical protein
MNAPPPADVESQKAPGRFDPVTIGAVILIMLAVAVTVLKIFLVYKRPHPLFILGIVTGRLMGYTLIFAPIAFLFWRFVLGRKRGAGLLLFSILALIATLLMPII